MITAGLIVTGIGATVFVVGIVARRLELRSRPHCPIHKVPMKAWNSIVCEEYACSVKGCSWHADVCRGTIKYFQS